MGTDISPSRRTYRSLMSVSHPFLCVHDFQSSPFGDAVHCRTFPLTGNSRLRPRYPHVTSSPSVLRVWTSHLLSGSWRCPETSQLFVNVRFEQLWAARPRHDSAAVTDEEQNVQREQSQHRCCQSTNIKPSLFAYSLLLNSTYAETAVECRARTKQRSLGGGHLTTDHWAVVSASRQKGK